MKITVVGVGLLVGIAIIAVLVIQVLTAQRNLTPTETVFGGALPKHPFG
jgi:hypothetical protein